MHNIHALVHYSRNHKVQGGIGPGIKDWHLCLGCLSSLPCTVLVIYTVLEGVITHFRAGLEPIIVKNLRPRAVHGVNSLVPRSETQTSVFLTFTRNESVYFVYTCSKSPYIRLSSVGLIYLYVGIFYICALFFAFKTSKVKVNGLNGAKYIAALVYTTSIVLGITCTNYSTTVHQCLCCCLQLWILVW